ncbi:AcvB/VirJ family lysyl-phosphatidylglycerol hydrolase [Hephaestia sp. GCM10023244]|uniref:AcvB/VirJ family lysyl-phosphatidylglycerol hydrolase n=1 Tax=unclassified Hephaestia TaxID=2631281 RepID=UPI00207734D5|nr:AcvB/VirJ family lysyl-phosphatidylglycerol hydrolase [Hephaestia sp. MAHUQ-44]MCM8729883.1 virulence factor family protein [Hephaestia sp. MAHUQ-44]
MRRLTLGLGTMAATAALLGLVCNLQTPACSAAPHPIAPASVAGRVTQTPLGPATTYLPKGPVRGVAVFLSGDGGWNLGVIDMAKALTQQGVVVTGLSTPKLLKALEADKASCIDPNVALTSLALTVEHDLGLAHYLKPILVGYSSGATVAYAALVQAPGGTYRAAVSLGFGSDIGGTKPWCRGTALAAARIDKPERGWNFAPTPHLGAPWIVLQGTADQVVSPAATRAFTAGIAEARLIELPKVGHGFSVEAHWMPQFVAAFTPLLETPPPAAASEPPHTASVGDLPLTLVADPKAPRTDLMAVLYSGDGGWAGLDRDVAAHLAAAGVPVVGVDSLAYFWNARNPLAAGQDLGRVVEHFSRQWQRPRVLLLGYSFGADTLPFIVGALPPALRPMIARVSLLGLSPSADFQFHLYSWLDVKGQNALPTVPAVIRLAGLPIQCIRGAQEQDSACPIIPPGIASTAVLPGGHHFDGNAGLVVATILHGVKA